MKLVLASASPRRKQILENAGLSFEIMVPDVSEELPKKISPEAAVENLAQRKANTIIPLCDTDTIVLSADTLVAKDLEVFGKPENEHEAREMLKKLSGNVHSVYTGVCLMSSKKKALFCVKTDVWFYPLTDREIDEYISTGEPLDKAGAYGIQGKGCVLVEKISGDYFNVCGLPIAKTIRELKKLSE